MKLFDAIVTAQIATYLHARRYKLTPLQSAIYGEMEHEAALEAPYHEWLVGAIDGDIGETKAWQVMLNCFWGSLGVRLELPGARLRVVLNQPTVAKAYQPVDGRLYCVNEGECAGKIGHYIRMIGSKGDADTCHADDLLIYSLNGYDGPEAIEDLVGILKTGSTISVAFPTSKHALWLRYFELLPPDLLLNAVAQRFKVERVFETVGDDYYLQVYGVS